MCFLFHILHLQAFIWYTCTRSVVWIQNHTTVSINIWTMEWKYTTQRLAFQQAYNWYDTDSCEHIDITHKFGIYWSGNLEVTFYLVGSYFCSLTNWLQSIPLSEKASTSLGKSLASIILNPVEVPFWFSCSLFPHPKAHPMEAPWRYALQARSICWPRFLKCSSTSASKCCIRHHCQLQFIHTIAFYDLDGSLFHTII